MTHKGSKVRLNPLNISLFYVLIGVIWILLPGQILYKFFPDPMMFHRVEVLNHGLFIIITAWVLHFLIRQNEAAIGRRQESMRRLNRSLKALSECNHTLIRAVDEHELMKEICRTVVTVGDYRLAWVGIAEHDENKMVRPVASWGDDNGYLETLRVSWAENEHGKGPTGTALRTRQTVVVQQIVSDPQWEFWREKALRHGFAASISLPLLHEGEPIGALVIFAGEPKAFDREEVRLLEGLAENMAYGVATLRMNAERKKVRQERKLLASVVEQANEGIILFDGEGVIQYVNPAMETITGYNPGEMLGKNIHELDIGGNSNDFYELVWDSISKGEARIGHFVFPGRNGARMEINSTIWAVADGTGGTGTYAVLIRDVTREVQLERQLRLAQKMEAIATLAGGIAHDFNNNLASIITCSEMARDDVPEDSPVRELLDVVLRAGYRGRNLVKQILTISCQGEQERQPVQVEQVVDECLKLLRASFPKSIDIHLNVAKDLGLVLADPTQIHQIIVNLCTNASHAMREKGGELEISICNVDLHADAVHIHRDLTAGRYMRLTVRDTGHGMSRDIMERIFDPFFTTKGKVEGTGLGLSVIHGIVKKHRGAITVSSVPGHGTTFHVYLPRVDIAKDVAVAEVPAIIPHGTERILLVDDEDDLAFGGKRMLERLGYQVTVCRDGREAYDLFRQAPERFDLIFTDQTMPMMTGTELAREALRIRADLPVILCTGLGPNSAGGVGPDEVRKLGIREIVYKPLGQWEVGRVIRRVLDGRGSEFPMQLAQAAGS